MADEGDHSDRPLLPNLRVAAGCVGSVGAAGAVGAAPDAVGVAENPAEAPGRTDRIPPGVKAPQCGLSPLWADEAPAWTRDPDHRRLTLQTCPCGGRLRAVAASSCRRTSAVGGSATACAPDALPLSCRP